VIISLIVLVILALPLASTFVRAARTARQVDEVRQTLERAFSDSEIVQVTIEEDRVMVTARGSQIITRADVRLAEQAVEQALQRDISLEVTYWRTLTP
jgi:regulatory protein YycI of two-component signal transduction system YycFG